MKNKIINSIIINKNETYLNNFIKKNKNFENKNLIFSILNFFKNEKNFIIQKIIFETKNLTNFKIILISKNNKIINNVPIFDNNNIFFKINKIDTYDNNNKLEIYLEKKKELLNIKIKKKLNTNINYIDKINKIKNNMELDFENVLTPENLFEKEKEFNSIYNLSYKETDDEFSKNKMYYEFMNKIKSNNDELSNIFKEKYKDFFNLTTTIKNKHDKNDLFLKFLIMKEDIKYL